MSALSSGSWGPTAVGPGVVLWTLQRIASRGWRRRRCAGLKSHETHLMVMDLDQQLRHMWTMAAAVWPAASDGEGIRGAAPASPSAVLLDDE